MSLISYRTIFYTSTSSTLLAISIVREENDERSKLFDYTRAYIEVSLLLTSLYKGAKWSFQAIE